MPAPALRMGGQRARLDCARSDVRLHDLRHVFRRAFGERKVRGVPTVRRVIRGSHHPSHAQPDSRHLRSGRSAPTRRNLT
jgi:hypothetical protein